MRMHKGRTLITSSFHMLRGHRVLAVNRAQSKPGITLRAWTIHFLMVRTRIGTCKSSSNKTIEVTWMHRNRSNSLLDQTITCISCKTTRMSICTQLISLNRKDWCIINRRLWVLQVIWQQVKPRAPTTTSMEHRVRAAVPIMGRTMGYRGCLSELSNHKDKKEIIIIIIRILRSWIISSLTERIRLIKRVRTLVVMVTNLSLEVDSLTTQTFLATHRQICKKEVPAMETSKAPSKSIWRSIRVLARPTTWTLRWQVMLTTYHS